MNKRRIIPIHPLTGLLIVGLCFIFVRLNITQQDRSDAFWNSAEMGRSGGNGYGWPFCFSWMGCFGSESHGSYVFVDAGIAVVLTIVAACTLEGMLRLFPKLGRTWFQFSLGSVLMCFIAASALLCLNVIPHPTYDTGQIIHGWPFPALDSTRSSAVDEFYLQEAGIYNVWGFHVGVTHFIYDALLLVFSPVAVLMAAEWWRRRNAV